MWQKHVLKSPFPRKKKKKKEGKREKEQVGLLGSMSSFQQFVFSLRSLFCETNKYLCSVCFACAASNVMTRLPTRPQNTVCAENIGRRRQESKNTSVHNTPSPASLGLTSYASVENLMANLTMHAESVLMPPPPLAVTGSKPKVAIDQSKRHKAQNGCVADSAGFNSEVHGPDFPRAAGDLSTRSGLRNGLEPLGLARIQMPPPSAPPPPPPPRSSSLFTAALIETSFGVDSNEPRTHIYANFPKKAQEPNSKRLDPHSRSMGPAALRSQVTGIADLKSSQPNVFASTMSMYQTWRDDHAVFDSESKCYSMSDVHNILPGPENELSRKGTPHWAGSTQSCATTKDSDTDSCQYGYTVVLSRTPKDDEKEGKHMRRQFSTGNYITADHCYSSLSKYKTLERGLNRDCVSTSDLHRGPPPPYKPPPKYERQSQKLVVENGTSAASPKLSRTARHSRTSTSSVSSYESARSHFSPIFDSPPLVNGLHTPPLPGATERESDSQRPLAVTRQGPGGQSKVSLTESYQQAINGSCTTPVGRNLFATSLRRAYSSPSKYIHSMEKFCEWHVSLTCKVNKKRK